MGSRRLALIAVEACLLWSVALTALAAVGNDWVLDRVAGGAYAGEPMPNGIRTLYGVTAAVSLAVIWVELRLFAERGGRVLRTLAWLVVGIFALSTIINAISPSAPERWNALPAALVALGTAYLLRTRV